MKGKLIKISAEDGEDMPDELRDALAEAIGNVTSGLSKAQEEQERKSKIAPAEAATKLATMFAPLDDKEEFKDGDLVMPKPSVWVHRWPRGGVMVFRRYGTPPPAAFSVEDYGMTHATENHDCVTGWLVLRGDEWMGVEFWSDSRFLTKYDPATATNDMPGMEDGPNGSDPTEILRRLNADSRGGRFN